MPRFKRLQSKSLPDKAASTTRESLEASVPMKPKVFQSTFDCIKIGNVVDTQSKLSGGDGPDRPVESSVLLDRRFFKVIRVGWLALGLASVALALISGLVLRSERESNAALQHLNLIALDLHDVLSDLADAESEERGYLLTRQPSSLESFKRSRAALGLEFDRLTALVKNNPVERQEVERIRYLVKQELDELQKSITSGTMAGPQAAFTEILTDRARKLTKTIRQSVRGIDEQSEGMLAQMARKRRVRLASTLAAVSGALLFAGSYLLIGQIMIARSVSRHRRTEEALRASEKRFETLCEQAPVGIYETDAQGQCIYTNARWSQMSGLGPAESLGHGWKKALHPDDRETVFKSWKTFAQRGASWQYRLMTPRGDIRWIRALGGPVFSTQGEITGYVGTAEDITELKDAHQALQERDALNSAILNSLPASIAVLDADGTIRAINAEWQRSAGANSAPPACFLNSGASYLEMCRRAAGAGSSDAEEAVAGVQDVLTGKLQSFGMHYPCHSDNEKRWFQMQVIPLAGVTGGGVVITHSDITERKQAEDATRKALQQLQLVTDNMPAGVTRCSRDLRYVWVSRSYAAWLGQAGPEEVSGRSIVDVVGREFFETTRPYIEKVLSGEKVEYETQVNYQGVGERWIHAVYVPTKAEDNTVDGWIAVVADVTERHEAEARLRESEELFRVTFFQAAIGIAQTSLDGHWILLNDRFCEILGYSRDELRGKTYIEITHPDDCEYALTAVRKLIAGEMQSWSWEKRYIRKNGETVWARLSVSLVRGQKNEPLYFIAAVEDITPRIKAEEKLRASEERFRNMADTAPVLIWLSGPDKGCIFFNKVWLEFTGRTMEQEKGNGWVEGVHPDDVNHCLEFYSSAFDARQRFTMEYRLRRADGAYRWLLDSGIPLFTQGNVFEGYIGCCIDITERMRAEEERQKFVSLADRSLEFISMYDLELRPFYVNAAGMRLVGLDNLEAACQVKVQDYFFPEDQSFITTDFFPRALRDGHGKVEIRFRHFKTGEPIWMIFNIFSVYNTRGVPVGWATVSIDITERRRAELALEQSRQELRASAGRLLHAEEEERKRISRELHDDLSQKLALLAFDTGGLLVEPFPEGEKLKEQLRNLQTRVQQLAQDVRQISHQLHPPILEDLGLAAALGELCAEFSAREGIKVAFEAGKAPRDLPIDIASCLYRVSQEALHNVLKHAQATEVLLKIRANPKIIHLCIQDNGVGFESQAGMSPPGLGIVSMKERVRLVQGEFSIQSQPGKGTEVNIFVPLPKENA